MTRPEVINFQTDTWDQIVRHARREIDRLRTENDNPLLSESETSMIRGEIKAWSSLIELPTADNIPVIAHTDEYI